MKNYVCGFLFNPEKTHVALIRKNKPEWQAGKLDGIGGKIEDGETSLQAIRREFKEETGATQLFWDDFATLSGRDGVIYFFHAIANPILMSPTSEPVDWYPLADLPSLPVIPNLRWLIPLALDESTKGVNGTF